VGWISNGECLLVRDLNSRSVPRRLPHPAPPARSAGGTTLFHQLNPQKTTRAKSLPQKKAPLSHGGGEHLGRSFRYKICLLLSSEKIWLLLITSVLLKLCAFQSIIGAFVTLGTVHPTLPHRQRALISQRYSRWRSASSKIIGSTC
jgi:hypothetical protein